MLKRLITSVALLSLLTQSVWAGEVINSLMESHPEEVKLTIRTRFGVIKEQNLKVMHYTYALNDGGKREETFKIKQVPDSRPFKQKLEEFKLHHPILSGVGGFAKGSVYWVIAI